MKKIIPKKQILIFISFCYILVIIFWLFSKSSISNVNGDLPYPLKISQSMNWIPFYFSSYIAKDIFIRNMIFKILIFTPLPFLFPSLFSIKKGYRLWLMKLLAFAFTIEFIQVYLLIGYFDITDIIYYLIGGTVSFFIITKKQHHNFK